jgi:hypothetical protein
MDFRKVSNASLPPSPNSAAVLASRRIEKLRRVRNS